MKRWQNPAPVLGPSSGGTGNSALAFLTHAVTCHLHSVPALPLQPHPSLARKVPQVSSEWPNVLLLGGLP